MRRGWIFVLLLVGFAGVAAAHAQVSAYVEATSAYLPDGPKGDFLFGGTAGVLIDGPKIFHRVLVSADVVGQFVDRSGEELNGVTVGPRFAFNPRYFKLAPYVGFDVGFARFNDSFNGRSTDSIFGGRGGITRQVSSRLDALVEYRYERFPYSFNLYHPQTLSAGVVYHFTKR